MPPARRIRGPAPRSPSPRSTTSSSPHPLAMSTAPSSSGVRVGVDGPSQPTRTPTSVAPTAATSASPPTSAPPTLPPPSLYAPIPTLADYVVAPTPVPHSLRYLLIPRHFCPSTDPRSLDHFDTSRPTQSAPPVAIAIPRTPLNTLLLTHAHQGYPFNTTLYLSAGLRSDIPLPIVNARSIKLDPAHVEAAAMLRRALLAHNLSTLSALLHGPPGWGLSLHVVPSLHTITGLSVHVLLAAPPGVPRAIHLCLISTPHDIPSIPILVRALAPRSAVLSVRISLPTRDHDSARGALAALLYTTVLRQARRPSPLGPAALCGKRPPLLPAEVARNPEEVGKLATLYRSRLATAWPSDRLVSQPGIQALALSRLETNEMSSSMDLFPMLKEDEDGYEMFDKMWRPLVQKFSALYAFLAPLAAMWFMPKVDHPVRVFGTQSVSREQVITKLVQGLERDERLEAEIVAQVRQFAALKRVRPAVARAVV